MVYDLQADLINGKTSREGHQLSIWEMEKKKKKRKKTVLPKEKQQLWEAKRKKEQLKKEQNFIFTTCL